MTTDSYHTTCVNMTVKKPRTESYKKLAKCVGLALGISAVALVSISLGVAIFGGQSSINFIRVFSHVAFSHKWYPLTLSFYSIAISTASLSMWRMDQIFDSLNDTPYKKLQDKKLQEALNPQQYESYD